MGLQVCIHLARRRFPNHQPRCTVGRCQQQPIRTESHRVDPIGVLLLLPLELSGERVVHADHLLWTGKSDQAVVITDVGSHHNIQLIANLGDPIPGGNFAQNGKAVDAVTTATDQNQLAVSREGDRLRLSLWEWQNTEQLACHRMVQGDLALTAYGDQRRPRCCA